MPPDSSSSADSAPGPTSELHQEILAFWVRVAALLGFSRSIGEIFGLIFISEAPLSADDIVGRLSLSRSATGQGLKTLLEIGAIRSVHQLASRKEHFQMQTDLGVLVKLLLNSRVLPRLEEISQQRQQLSQAVEARGESHLVQRFEKLQRWQEKTSPLVDILKALTH